MPQMFSSAPVSNFIVWDGTNDADILKLIRVGSTQTVSFTAGPPKQLIFTCAHVTSGIPRAYNIGCYLHVGLDMNGVPCGLTGKIVESAAFDSGHMPPVKKVVAQWDQQTGQN
jgi:hypothetical protein